MQRVSSEIPPKFREFFMDSENLASEIMDLVLDRIDVEDEHIPLNNEDVLMVIRAVALVATPFFTAISDQDDKLNVAATMVKEMLSGKKKLDS